ncbi:MAG: carbohydrate kinase family protein [Lachnospiraceae bacterium]|nr:carbohydrate kinase family protein [Lachnospiraceae bacterium]
MTTNTKHSADIVGIDILWYDQILILPSMPGDNSSCFVEEASFQGGGKVASALVSAARQGVSCRLLAMAGDDSRSRFLIRDLEDHAVETDGIRVLTGYEIGWSVVLSDKASGGRRILWHKNDNQPQLTREDIRASRDAIAQARFLHLCRTDEADLEAAAIARENGVPVCFDADFYSSETEAALPLIDIFIGSEEFYDTMFGNNGSFEENCLKIRDRGPETIIFTFGSRGCRGLVDGEFFSCPAFSVDVVDTVGAGDDFHGGYLAALCLGYRPGYDAARYASALSAIKCTAVGGRAGIPTRTMIEQFLAEGTYSREEIEKRTAYYSTIH